MKEFKGYHPIVNFLYFIFTIGLGCFFMHPVCLGISIASGFAYSAMLKGRKAVKNNLIYMLPMLALTALINPVFNHRGVTIITYFPGGNPLTMEAIIYGLCAAAMVAGVICLFSCFNEVMTSDKFIYLFGNTVASVSLIVSMTLRFVPRFVTQFKEVANAQKCMGKDIKKGSILKRWKQGIRIMSIMISRALENSVETADSMKARGYGLPGRTSFSVFTFDKRDKKAVVWILFFGIYSLAGYLNGAVSFNCFPSVQMAEVSFWSISVFLSYLFLFITPIIIEIREVIRWKALRSKI